MASISFCSQWVFSQSKQPRRIMESSRIPRLLWLTILIFVSTSSAISLLGVLQSYPQLSTFYDRVNNSTKLTALLAGANNFTLLAANNAAFAASENLTDDDFVAYVQYSLLQGTIPSLSITNDSQFVPSALINASYANVTGGQRVELVQDVYGVADAVTGDRSVSVSNSTDIVCVGGIVHIVNSVLTVPLTAVLEITAAQLKYFVSILSVGGYLQDSYVNDVLGQTDQTYFIPNSAGALASFTALDKSATAADLEAMFEYHVVPNFVGYSPLLTDGLSLNTSQGTPLTIHIQGGDIYVNAAKLIQKDYMVANGVVHVIDSLLDRTNTSGPLPVASATSATSSAAPTATSTTSSTKTSAAAVALGHSSSKGKTIGIAVGVTVGALAIIAVAAYFLWQHRQRKQEDAALWSNEPMAEVPYGDQTGGAKAQNGAGPTIPRRSLSRVVHGNGGMF